MKRLLTVQEAAKALGITPEAVRGRIQRGTLPKEKAKDGTVYVRLIAIKCGQPTMKWPMNRSRTPSLWRS